MAYEQRTEKSPRTFRLRNDVGAALDERVRLLGMTANRLINDVLAKELLGEMPEPPKSPNGI